MFLKEAKFEEISESIVDNVTEDPKFPRMNGINLPARIVTDTDCQRVMKHTEYLC